MDHDAWTRAARRRFILGLALGLALLPAIPLVAQPSEAAPAPQAVSQTAAPSLSPDPVADLRAQLDALKAEYERRIAEIEKRLAELQAAPGQTPTPATAEATPPPAPAPETPPSE